MTISNFIKKIPQFKEKKTFERANQIFVGI
jgi:hypothetical protein